ncbi:MAG: O-antigen ligase family protein [Prolixibacteraceae bacterium]|jgi:hypothetical protein|nr:O-antigen ligase family protein [Prolixibacteraceae bacterium]
MLKRITHQTIYFWQLLAVAISLPTSKALMSIFPFILLLNWLCEGRLKEKMKVFAGSPSIWLLTAVFGLYLLGLSWTDSLKWGLHDLKIQIPLLIFPLVIGTSRKLNLGQIKTIVVVFAATVVFASLCSMYVWLGFAGTEVRDVRDISLFISHIRFSLLINIVIFVLCWFIFNRKLNIRKTEKFAYFVIAAWLVLFLFILRSFTGIVIFILVSMALALWFSSRIRNVVLRFPAYVFLLMIPVFIGAYITRSINEFYNTEEFSKKELEAKTRLGNAYQHVPANRQVENGHFVFLFISEDELREAWNQRSNFKYDSTYTEGFNKYALLRYMTSKGLRKDAEGLSKLSDDDICNIGKGIPNYRFANKYSLSNRIYQTIWEFNEYANGANPAGNSVVQRIEYLKVAWQIVRENFWFGTGTGGYYPAYQEKYDAHPFFNDPKFRQRSHNMFLSYWVDFGLVGLLFICFAYIYPVFRERKTKSYLLLTFSLVVLLSFLNEDTLNNHDGITFFAFFYSLFLFSSYEDGTPAE